MRQAKVQMPTTFSPQTVNCCLTPKYIFVSSSVPLSTQFSNNFLPLCLFFRVIIMNKMAFYIKRGTSYRQCIITYIKRYISYRLSIILYMKQCTSYMKRCTSYRQIIKVYIKRTTSYRQCIITYIKRCTSYRLSIISYMKRCISYRLGFFTTILSLKSHLDHFYFYNNYISNQNITTVLLINY